MVKVMDSRLRQEWCRKPGSRNLGWANLFEYPNTEFLLSGPEAGEDKLAWGDSAVEEISVGADPRAVCWPLRTAAGVLGGEVAWAAEEDGGAQGREGHA